MSIDDYIAPDGRRLEGNGVTPDHVVVQTADDLRAGRDPVLDAARKYLLEASARERSD
jgi:C-terminal processing protease CtpA/Prc